MKYKAAILYDSGVTPKIEMIRDTPELNVIVTSTVDDKLIFTHPCIKIDSLTQVTFRDIFDNETTCTLLPDNGFATLWVVDKDINLKSNYCVNVVIELHR